MKEKILSVVGKLLLTFLIIIHLFLILNANFSFLTDITVLKILNAVKNIGSLLFIVIMSFKIFSKGSMAFRIIFFLLLLAIIVFMFFPSTYQNLMIW